MVKMMSYDEDIKKSKKFEKSIFLFLFRWPWGSRRAAREPEIKITFSWGKGYWHLGYRGYKEALYLG